MRCQNLAPPHSIKEFISIWTISLLKTKRRALPRAGNGPMPYRPQPVPPQAVIPAAGARTLPSRSSARALHDSPLDVYVY